MIAIPLKKVRYVQSMFTDDIEKQRSNALSKLIKLDRPNVSLSKDERDYLRSVIALFGQENLLNRSPTEICTLKDTIGELPKDSRTPKKLPSLKTLILEKLNYKYLRSSFYPKYFHHIGIKACVYCNSTLTISVPISENEYIASFDVDHYHSKDDYPFLSIFLFNLYPACASCNRRKGRKIVNFNLYSDNSLETKSSSFQFKLDNGAKAKYLLTKDPHDLSFSFHPVPNPLQQRFRIEELYGTQKDLIEELIIKQAMYDKYNQLSLLNNFRKLDLNPELFLRSLIGNYVRVTEIHKRPMAKFMQDIGYELGLIKKE